MHLWQYEAQFGFCFRLDLTTLGQANMLRRKPIPGILAGSLALLKLLSSPIRNLLLTSPPWQGFILILTFLRYVLTVTDVYWHLLTWKLKMVLLTWPGGAHFLLRLLLHPVEPAVKRINIFWGWMIGKDWKGLERIGKNWKGLERWHTVKVPEPLKKFSCELMCTGSSESPYSVHPSTPAAIAAKISYHRMGPKVSIHRLLSTWSLREE